MVGCWLLSDSWLLIAGSSIGSGGQLQATKQVIAETRFRTRLLGFFKSLTLVESAYGKSSIRTPKSRSRRIESMGSMLAIAGLTKRSTLAE
jgi:hypothetical protein